MVRRDYWESDCVFTTPHEAALSLTITAGARLYTWYCSNWDCIWPSCALRRVLDAFPTAGREHPEEVAEPLDFQMVFESGCWQSYKEYFAIVTFWRWFCCCVWFWIQKLFFLDSKKLCLSSAPDDIIFQIWWHNINKKDNALENGFRNRNIS